MQRTPRESSIGTSSPRNIFITERDQARILDFGLAKSTSEHALRSSEVTADFVTDPGVAVGTAAYMSPEQVRGEALDTRTDLFSFGVVLYEMVTGQIPFPGATSGMVFDGILNRLPLSASHLRPAITPRLEEVINKALEKDKTLRYQHASEMRSDLRRLKRDSGSDRAVKAQTGTQPLPTHGSRINRLALLALTIVIAAGAVAVWLVRARRISALTQKDTVVLADVTNKTGDPVFDDALKTALASSLEQSPFLNILSERKVQTNLQLMDRKAGERVTPQVAQDICERSGSKAVIASSIASIGSNYLISLTTTGCRTGETIATAEQQVARKEDVLKGLTKATAKLREQLGESLSSIAKFDVPLEQATTPSLEALKALSVGRKLVDLKGDLEAIPFFKNAIRLDPNFALGYLALGSSLSNIGEDRAAAENIRKGFELRNGVSEKEKLAIAGLYYIAVSGQLPEAIQNFSLWSETYPSDSVPHVDLGLCYSYLGRFEESLAQSREAWRLDPDNAIAAANISSSLLDLNRLEEATANNRAAIEFKLDGPYLHLHIYQIAFLEGDRAEMDRQVAWSRGNPYTESIFQMLESWTAAYGGRLRAAREHARAAIEIAKRGGLPGTADLWQSAAAWTEAEVGQPATAVRLADASIGSRDSWRPRIYAIAAFAKAGDSRRANQIVEEFRNDRPLDTLIHSYWVPIVNALLELRGGNGQAALEALHATNNMDLADPAWSGMYLPYVRGQAYLQVH
jgi:eukaryotic-like serine/threonine-protein kinase